ncbi:hypothetical protein [Dyadobacter sp. BHUBP1]|uniref:hypothetical protein n=1 Tax=Dyadobacter sp. BHUBP1 TaxID=3424178 RepID=UPI003D33564E
MHNFSGIKSFAVQFGESTTIAGINRSGKTTLLHAHLWLWTGKDALDRENYEIKPRDAWGKTTPSVDVVVCETWIRPDGEELSLKREFVEVWEPAIETREPYLKTNSTRYYIDGVLQKTETVYRQQLNEIISAEGFRILSSPEYFLSMKPEPQREILLELVGGDISEQQIVEANQRYKKLGEVLRRKSYDQYCREVNANLATLEKQKSELKPRINEKALDINGIEAQLGLLSHIEGVSLPELQTQLDEVVLAINKLSSGKEFDLFRAAHEKKNTLMLKKQQIRLDFASQELQRKADLKSKRVRFQGVIDRNSEQATEIGYQILKTQDQINRLDSEIESLRQRYDSVQQQEFEGETDENCPVCKRPFSKAQLQTGLQQLISNFNEQKVSSLSQIRTQGITKTNELNKLKELLAQSIPLKERLVEECREAEIQLKGLVDQEAAIETFTPYVQVLREIEELELALANPPEVDDAALQAEKAELIRRISEIHQAEALTASLISSRARMQQLLDEEAAVNQQLNEWLRAKFIVEQFSKDRSAALEQKVNQRFKIVRFQLFKYLNDGTPKEFCMPTLNGVYYPKVNTEGKASMYLDIVSTFSEHYGVCLPAWIDNMESIVIGLPKANGQTVHLIADAAHKNLTVLEPVN